jgi:menaquinone-dependent protoporphyrinogen IX oxidase
MKKGVIIYKSKYGATEQYADWLSDAIQCAAMRPGKISHGRLGEYDLLILGSPVYIGKLQIRKWLREHLSAFAKKQVILFIVCGTSEGEPDEQSRIVHDNLPPDFIARTKIFFLPGRCLTEQISIKDRLLLAFGSLVQKDPQIKAAMRWGFDKVDRNRLEPLVAVANEYLKEDLPA